MPRKKAAEVEILLPEDDQPSRGRKKLVEAEHTIKYSAPVPVVIEEETEEEDLLLDDDPVDTEKKRKRKTAKTERDELRKKLMNHGVTAASTLKLIIERYVHSDGPDSGTTAEKAHCTKYGCDESHILNQDYMDVAAKWGAGRYWFTLYKDGTIVSQWEKRLEPSRQITPPIIQNINPNDPNSPQVVFQNDGQQIYQPMSMKDMVKAQRESLKEELEFRRLLMESYGMAPNQQATQPIDIDPEIAALRLIAKNPDVMEKLGNGIAKTILGTKGGDGDPWAEVAKEAIKSGQAVEIVRAAIDALFNGFSGLFPKGQNNGQPSSTQTQAQATMVAPTTTPAQYLSDPNALLGDEVQPTHSERTSDGVPTVTPEEQALAIVLNNCARKVPVQITADQVLKYADLLNDQAPQYSIDGYLQMFAAMTPESAIEFAKTQPNGEQVASLEWAREYTEQLQKLIRESMREGDDA